MLSPAPSSFSAGLRASIPLTLGYFPMGISFGVAALQSGLSLAEALALSFLIYAGTAQFLILALFAAGTPALIIVFSALAVNLRHLFYGPAVMERAGRGSAAPNAWAWSFFLTDGTFGSALTALAGRKAGFSEPWMWGLSLPPYAAWVGGTAIGVVLSGAVSAWPALEAGLGFLMPSLFLAMLLSMLSREHIAVIAVTVLVTLALVLLVSPTVGVLAGMVIGAAAGTVRRKPLREAP